MKQGAGGEMIKHPLIWIAALFAAGFTAFNWYQKQPDKLVRYSKDLPSILYLVQEAYVDEVDMAHLMPGAFQGVLDAVDENASYIPPGEQPADFREKIFERSGLTVAKLNGYAYIMAVAVGSPAYTAGARPDTYIQQIGSQSTRLLSRYRIEQLLATLTPIELTIVSPTSADEEQIRFVPGPFEGESLQWGTHEGAIQVISLSRFDKGLERELRKKLGQVTDGKVVLDLRNNAMGDETELAWLASLFLPAGKFGSWVDAQGKTVKIDNPRPGKFTGLELYLWINRGTSGAAESFCAAAQDGKTATIIGTESLGYPLHYQPIALASGGFLQLSTRDFVLNSGKTLTRAGIIPDLALENEEGGELQLADALEVIRRRTSEKAETAVKHPNGKG